MQAAAPAGTVRARPHTEADAAALHGGRSTWTEGRLVRDAMPGIALSTDIIVAFPGESGRGVRGHARPDARGPLRRCVPLQVLATRRHARDTTAGRAVRRARRGAGRLQRLIDLHRSIQAQINHGEVGSTVEVLVERVRPARPATCSVRRTTSRWLRSPATTPSSASMSTYRSPAPRVPRSAASRLERLATRGATPPDEASRRGAPRACLAPRTGRHPRGLAAGFVFGP
jgi:hypothetical protein